MSVKNQLSVLEKAERDKRESPLSSTQQMSTKPVVVGDGNVRHTHYLSASGYVPYNCVKNTHVIFYYPIPVVLIITAGYFPSEP